MVYTIERDEFADQLKYLLMFLVVLGHSISPWHFTPGLGGLWNWIYSFHMPLFVFISGYFSQRIIMQRLKEIDLLLFPYLLFQFIHLAYSKLPGMESLDNNFFSPYHANWYILALFVWRTFIPYARFFNKKKVIIVAILFSLLSGFFFTSFMGLNRIVYYFPFFIMGYYTPNFVYLTNKVVNNKRLWIFVFIISFLIVFGLSMNRTMVYEVWCGVSPTQGYGDSLKCFLIRTLFFIAAVPISLSVLCIAKILYNYLNIRKLKYSGGGTMCLFLMHEFVLIPLWNIYSHMGITGILVAFVTSLLIFWIFTQKKVTDFFSPLLSMNTFMNKINNLI